jgi:hypothetical protein
VQPQPERFHRRPVHGTGVAPASRRRRAKNKSGDWRMALYFMQPPMTKHPHIPELKEPDTSKDWLPPGAQEGTGSPWPRKQTVTRHAQSLP